MVGNKFKKLVSTAKEIDLFIKWDWCSVAKKEVSDLKEAIPIRLCYGQTMKFSNMQNEFFCNVMRKLSASAFCRQFETSLKCSSSLPLTTTKI